MRFDLLGAATLLAVTATAQNYYIPDSNAAAGTCNVIPFGSTSPGSFYQSLYQCKASAADLGNVPNVITGIGFAPCNSGVANYTYLEIVIDHHPAGVPLSTTFANNLTPNAVTVLAAPNYFWNLTGNAWNEIGLQDLFVYNGTDDIVIQVTSVDGIAPSGFHRDTRQRVYWIAASGSPAPTGSSGNAALKFEVSMLTAKLSTHGEGCPGSNGVPTLTLTGSPQINTTVGVDLANGAPNSVGFAAYGFYNGNPPFPLDLGSLGMAGCNQYHDIVAVVAAPTDPTGAASLPFVIPNVASYVGVKIYAQFACIDPAANAAGVTTSNYGRIFIGQ